MFHHDFTESSPDALTVCGSFMNLMDLPKRNRVFRYSQRFRVAQCGDTATSRFRAVSAMIFYSIRVKGLGGWLHELYASPFGIRPWWAAPLLVAFNLLFNLIEYVSKPLSHSLRLFGNMYAGEIMFLLIALLASSGIAGAIGGGLAQILWIGFDGFIAILQAYIFMMLTIAYISMAHEHH
jgi:F0F1-type ATP synthase membrane subunit a